MSYLFRLAKAGLLAFLLGLAPSGQAQEKNSDGWQLASLDDGRYQVLMPGKSYASFAINNAIKIYTNGSGTTVVNFSVTEYSPKGAADAERDPVDFLKRFCDGFMDSWNGRDVSFEKIANAPYPAIECRFRHDGPLPPPGHAAHRVFYVHGQICSLFVTIGKNEYDADEAMAKSMVAKIFDSLVIDRERPRPVLFEQANRDRTQWPDAPPGLESRFDKAHGMLTDQFAFCQTMDLDEFHWACGQLRPCGHRPVTIRPYVVDGFVKVAATWTRDGAPWMLATGQQLEQVEQMHAKIGSAIAAMDAFGWELDGKVSYGALWAFTPRVGLTRLSVGVAEKEFEKSYGPLTDAGYQLLRRQRFFDAQQQVRQNSIHYKSRPDATLRFLQTGRAEYEAELAKSLVPYDISLSYSPDGSDATYLVSLSNASRMYKESHGLTPVEHLQQCRLFAREGFVPASIAAAYREGRGYVTASVWHKQLGEP